MNTDKTVAWSLRLITAAMILVPLAYCYFTSGSLQGFLIPALTFPSDLASFNPSSIRLTSLKHEEAGGNTYLISIGLLNAGNVRIGLKEVDGRISVPSLDISGRVALQSPFVLEPGEEETVYFSFFLERGTLEELLNFLSHKPPVNISGNATLVLDSAELPFILSITNLSIGS